MAKFNDQIKFGKCQAAYLKRNAILNDMYENVLSIESLDQVNPSLRTFQRQESSANRSLEELKVAKRELYILLEQANHNIKDDEEFIADQKEVIKDEFALINAIEDYIKVLNDKGIAYPPEVKPEPLPGNLSDILNNLVASQNKNMNDVVASQTQNLTNVIDAQNKNVSDLSQSLINQLKTHTVSSSKGPKPTQPKFKPKGNDSDYGEFKDFYSKFEFFTSKCNTNVEKLQWL